MVLKVSAKEYKKMVEKVGPEKMRRIEDESIPSGVGGENTPEIGTSGAAGNIVGLEYLTKSKKEGIPVTDCQMTVWERKNLGKHIVADEKDIPLVETNKKEIMELHNSIQDLLKMSLEKAIQVGELLLKQKELIRHGGFGRWIRENMPFRERTAQNYMKLYNYSHLLADKKIDTLADAYAAINGEPAPNEVVDVDDSTDVSNRYVVEKSNAIEDVERPVLPPKKANGLMTAMVIDHKLIQELKSEKSSYAGQKHKYVKIVVPIPPDKYQDPQLIGEFTCAVSSLLKAGGKLIYHKKQ